MASPVSKLPEKIKVIKTLLVLALCMAPCFYTIWKVDISYLYAFILYVGAQAYHLLQKHVFKGSVYSYREIYRFLQKDMKKSNNFHTFEVTMLAVTLIFVMALISLNYDENSPVVDVFRWMINLATALKAS